MSKKMTQDEINKLPSVTMGRRDILRGLAAGTVIPLVVAGCETSDGLGSALVSDAQIQQASQAAWVEAQQRERRSTNARYNSQVQRVGQRIVQASGQTQHAWEFVVFESPQRNAWVLPNGKVAFYTGLLDVMENDDQVATVMGHEVGHLARRHATQRARRQASAGLGLAIINAGLGAAGVQNADTWAGILGTGVQYGVILPYSREHELEADQLGVQYMAAGRYNPVEALRFWQTLSAQGGRAPAELLSTHPSSSTRMQALSSQLRGMGYTV